MDGLPNLKPSVVQPYLSILDHVRESGLIDRFEADMSVRLSDLTMHIQDIAVHYYQEKMNPLQAAPGGNITLPLLLMTDELEKAAKLLDKRFPDPLVGYDFARRVDFGILMSVCSDVWIWSLLWWKLKFLCSSKIFRILQSVCTNRR